MEFIELNCLCKRIKKINKKQLFSIYTNSCVELTLKFFPEINIKTKNNSRYAVKFVEESGSSFSANLMSHFVETSVTLTLFRMGFFGAAHGWGGGLFGPPP